MPKAFYLDAIVKIPQLSQMSSNVQPDTNSWKGFPNQKMPTDMIYSALHIDEGESHHWNVVVVHR